MKKLKYIFLILICFIGLNICSASTKTYERSEDNLRVNKKWDINSRNIDNVLNTPSVDASEKVYDFADILTDEEEKEVKSLIDDFIDRTGFDMVFVSDSFTYYDDEDNEEYASDFYDYNDFGLDDEHYSGIILFRNANEADPYYGAYYFGEAQLYYPPERYNLILDDIYNNFSQKNYLPGIKMFLEMSELYYNNGIPSSMNDYYIDDMGYLQKHYNPPILLGIVISTIITAIVIGVLVKKNKMIAQETKAYEYLDPKSISYTVKRDQFITSHTSSYSISTSSGGSSGGGSFHSSSGSSGGGHSGGGRHG